MKSALSRVASTLLQLPAVKTIRTPTIDPRDLPAVEWATLRRILSQVAPYRWSAVGVLACIAGAAGLGLVAPWFLKRAIDVAIPQGNVPLLWLYCAGMVAGPAAAALLQVAQKYHAERIGQQVMLDMRVRVYQRLHDMPFDYFAKQQPGEAVSHVLNDVQGVGGVVSSTLVDLAQNAIVLAFTLTFVTVLDWRLSLVAIAFLPMFIAATRRVGRARKALKRSAQARTGELTGMLTEALSVSGALNVKLFGRERAEVERVSHKLEELKGLALRQALVGRWFQMLMGLCESIGPAVVLGIGGMLVISGHHPLGTVIAFIAVLKRVYGPATQLAGAHVDLKVSYACFDRIFDVVDRTPAIRCAERAVAPPAVSGAIDFKHVTLAYDGSHDALHDVSLRVPAGTTLGIVGPSGAGKTSLASLVMRLYDPTAGSVHLDGVDVREIRLDVLRQYTAVVPQDTFLLNATVLENLRYAKADATRAEIETAARHAHIHDVIVALPLGYDTLVGERGYRFSAGERQRLAIARAILKNPQVLILDEATSALDAPSEQVVQQALRSVLAGRTGIVIAHRLSTVRDADCIAVMNEGRVVELGTHEQLMSRSGLYAWMWWVQTRDGARAPKRPPTGTDRKVLPLRTDRHPTVAQARDGR